GDDIILAGEGAASDLATDQAFCISTANSHYENFLVLSRFTPKALVEPMAAVYAWSRYADDLGDEAPFSSDVRAQLLKRWADLTVVAHQDGWTGPADHPILTAVAAAGRTHDLPVQPFLDLAEAFTMDQGPLHPESIADLDHYSSRSADPVGRLVLRIHGHDDPQLDAWSDDICTGLQIANLMQDVRRDAGIGRVYIPRDLLRSHDAAENDVLALRSHPGVHAAIVATTLHARSRLRAGRALVGAVDPHLAVQVDLFARGGEMVVAAILRRNGRTLTHRPRVGRLGRLRLVLVGILASRRLRAMG
ncbi:MAG TPA: squalene/phytoene synthase family protein, partial [Candidatus Poseidoniales archaeon]|nr:squalene/phytoene synthase family protein [Candidatus Poseidoniales archaeon]